MYESIFTLIGTHLARKELRQAMKLLANDPGLINYHDTVKGNTILHEAVFHGSEIMVNWILDYGVNLLSQNIYGTTALHRSFILQQGSIAALLYYYEQQIPDHPFKEENNIKLATLFFTHRSEFHTKAWHDEQVEAFRKKTEDLLREKAPIPPKTLELTLKSLGRLHSESKESDGSGSGSGSGIDPAEVLLTENDEKTSSLRHRTVFAAAGGAPVTDSGRSADSK